MFCMQLGCILWCKIINLLPTLYFFLYKIVIRVMQTFALTYINLMRE